MPFDALGAAGIGASIIGGALDFFGSSDASDTEAAAFQAALDLQREIFEETKANFRPFIEGGTNAFNRAGRLLEGDISEFQVSPGFRFRQQEGERGVIRNLNALGLAGSGAALKDLSRFNQGLAAEEFGNFFNRNLQLAGLGQASAAGQAAAGSNFANTASNLLVGQGAARARGDMALANAFGGATQNALNSVLLSRIFQPTQQQPAPQAGGGGIG